MVRYDLRISLSTLSEPDCSGMCNWGHTVGVSAMASITSEVNSAGWGDVNRTRSRPVISPQARNSREKAERSRGRSGSAKFTP